MNPVILFIIWFISQPSPFEIFVCLDGEQGQFYLQLALDTAFKAHFRTE